MASFFGSAMRAGSRTLASRSKTLTVKSLIPNPSTRSLPRASRIVSALGGLESMMPLHSAIASARLQSSIAVDSSCWSCLSQGFSSLPLKRNSCLIYQCLINVIVVLTCNTLVTKLDTLWDWDIKSIGSLFLKALSRDFWTTETSSAPMS
ncbi:hypothetical protein CXB51_034097 [Gossypium anomalum]|uniref:Protein NUCLEAR FUSION DEFECTIVE 6, chloroplastic/mitochondrial-like n=3 Tax=Gossypium TaxID=3633 RepID=A0A8J5Y657_9ROSI|nr:protein NUCLEAR FUSION DEFECTIVE 6, chloroplastic/mitochondrial isoform X1 [Gossypium australe]KAG8474162.1 hypothetical protein CXB51_034097 [Gossypium anomalum]